MKTIRIALYVVILAAALSACAALLRIQGQAAEKIAQGVEDYCQNTDATFRANFRAEVNAKAAPNSVAVHCDGDPAQ